MAETAQVKDMKYGPIVAVVNSASDLDTKYEVRSLAGELRCQCKGWIFNRDTPRQCKHTRAVASGKSLPAATVSRKPAAASDVRTEAAKAAQEIIQRGSVAFATDRIEQAIKKFMSTLAVTSVVSSPVEALSGVRMITLEE